MSGPCLLDIHELIALATANGYSLGEILKLLADSPALAEFRIAEDHARSLFRRRPRPFLIHY